MLKKIIFCFFIHPILAHGDFILLNMNNLDELPKNFRNIPELHAAGSGQFSEKSLEKVIATIGKSPIRIIDLREESHGFANGIAISLYGNENAGNLGKSVLEIECDEYEWLQELLLQGTITAFTKTLTPQTIPIKSVSTEKALTASHHLEYMRIPVTDHRKSTLKQIDRFVEMIKTLSEETWLYIHCAAGRGRTTSFLAYLDMMKNAQKFTLEQIAARQESFGGLNILKGVNPNEWKYSYIQDRIELTRLFYQYCKTTPKLDIPFSEWVTALEFNHVFS